MAALARVGRGAARCYALAGLLLLAGSSAALTCAPLSYGERRAGAARVAVPRGRAARLLDAACCRGTRALRTAPHRGANARNAVPPPRGAPPPKLKLVDAKVVDAATGQPVQIKAINW